MILYLLWGSIFGMLFHYVMIVTQQEVEFTEDDVCDWIDEIGGIFNPEGQVLLYFKYIVEHTVMAVQGTPKEEKKKSSKVRLG